MGYKLIVLPGGEIVEMRDSKEFVQTLLDEAEKAKVQMFTEYVGCLPLPSVITRGAYQFFYPTEEMKKGIGMISLGVRKGDERLVRRGIEKTKQYLASYAREVVECAKEASEIADEVTIFCEGELLGKLIEEMLGNDVTVLKSQSVGDVDILLSEEKPNVERAKQIISRIDCDTLSESETLAQTDLKDEKEEGQIF